MSNGEFSGLKKLAAQMAHPLYESNGLLVEHNLRIQAFKLACAFWKDDKRGSTARSVGEKYFWTMVQKAELYLKEGRVPVFEEKTDGGQ